MFSSEVQTIIDELLPVCRELGQGRDAIALSGSHGKGTADRLSDLDFRLYCEHMKPHDEQVRVLERMQPIIDRWATEGYVIDGCWTRTIGEVEEGLERWLAGDPQPESIVWTIWGYHLPTDIYSQTIVDDPHGILARWKSLLATYPPALKRAILGECLTSLRYWRQDYHYRHKVQRRDTVFLAGLTTKLVHEMIQVLFALNETYYVGDGNNLSFVAGFAHAPSDFPERVERVLYPGEGEERLVEQREILLGLIDDVEALAKELDEVE